MMWTVGQKYLIVRYVGTVTIVIKLSRNIQCRNNNKKNRAQPYMRTVSVTGNSKHCSDFIEYDHDS